MLASRDQKAPGWNLSGDRRCYTVILACTIEKFRRAEQCDTVEDKSSCLRMPRWLSPTACSYTSTSDETSYLFARPSGHCARLHVATDIEQRANRRDLTRSNSNSHLQPSTTAMSRANQEGDIRAAPKCQPSPSQSLSGMEDAL